MKTGASPKKKRKSASWVQRRRNRYSAPVCTI